MAATTRIRLCSALTVETGAGSLSGRALGSRKARTLLALLAAERGGLVPVDRIVEVLWPADPPADPGANVATLVSRTRRLLGAEVITGTRAAYGLVPGSCTVDLDEAGSLVREAGARLAAGESGLAAAASRRALELLGSTPALPDETDSDWVVQVRAEVDELRRVARHVLAQAVTSVDPDEAATVATAAMTADPYDERAVRDLMRALAADGAVAAALATYDALARRLRDDLGIDPAAPTAELHLAILRQQEPAAEHHGAAIGRRTTSLVGRDSELATIDRAWAAAGAGEGRLVLVDGVGGIGKTRLLDATSDLVESTGGLVLRGRCHPAERSLFLQPFVDALRPVLLGSSDAELGALLREHTAPWALLVPELAEVVEVSIPAPATAAIERRRAYDAVAAVLRRLSRRRPLLLAVDDLQDGGAATVDLLGFLAGRLSAERVLLYGAVRAEDAATISRLSDRATTLTLAALSPAAVETLASSAGLAAHADEVMGRTAGHSLSVVEYLRALAVGEAGVPESLAAAVLARVARLDGPAQQLVQGASVLHGRLDPPLLADLVEIPEVSAVRLCEELVLVGLFHRDGASYEFANDLTQECVALSLPPALSVAHHRRAADLLSDQPESMAVHAYAAGELERAAHGWLLAGRSAMDRSAVEDAIALYDRAVDVAADPSLRGRVLLARALAHEASTAYAASLADIDEALALAHGSGDRRLEMAALRSRGGDPPIGLRLPMTDIERDLEAGLRLATGLGDRVAEADFNGRLTVIGSSRLRLATALSRAELSLARSRASASPEAVHLALDGLKNVLSYLGDVDRLRDVVAELAPPLRERESRWLLQWAVFESAFVAAADRDWDTARSLVREALDINVRSGFTAYAGYFHAHLGWFERLAGDLDAALSHGRRGVAATSPVEHPWWYATAAGLLASTLVDLGATEEAAELARRGLDAAGPAAPEAWRLRCLAPLALVAEGDAGDASYAEASALLEGIECPPGHAWVNGADCYLLLARSARLRGDHAAAARMLEPLREAVRVTWGAIREQVERELAQSSSATS